MAVPGSVLVAVDFGEESARAVEVGGAIASHCANASLRLLHAASAEAPAYFTASQVEALEHQRHALAKQAEQFLTTFGRQHTSKPFTTIVSDQLPVDAILREAATADLVVMGTHGRQGLRRWWLGSVAERVLQSVSRPLLIVRSDFAGPATSAFGRVVVHATGRLKGDATLQYARDLTTCFGGSVIDARHALVEPSIQSANATLLVAAAPEPRSTTWLANYGEPVVRFCTIPILFVPEGA